MTVFITIILSGVTLARIERVDGAARTVHLSACDLVHGTPVLDIKVRTAQLREAFVLFIA